MAKNFREKIFFSQFDESVYSGRPRGESARAKVDLNRLDNLDVIVECILPDKTELFTSSFFLGMFEDSIKKYQDKKTFFEKYIFINLPDDLKEQFSDWYDRALNKIKSGV